MGSGNGWNLFRSHSGPFADHKITQGKHLLTVTVLQGDVYGVEIDAVTIHLDITQPYNIRTCDVFCFDDVSFVADGSLSTNTSLATALQLSYKTTCAEADNVNIPVIHESAKKFMVTASFPKYISFMNNRKADWSNCKPKRNFECFDVDFSKDKIITYITSTISISTNHRYGFGLDDYHQIGELEVSFSLPGQTTGSVDSELGSLIVLRNMRFNGTMTVTFEYFNRYDQWIGGQSKTFINYLDQVIFEIPDFNFREGTGNLIKMKFYTNETSADSFRLKEIFITQRGQQDDVSTTIYKDANTAIETVDIEFWWKVNETMTITLTNTGETFHDADYFRLVRRVPWAAESWSQVFVMYQDGNIRLLTLAPHGLDWIPFGSSVIIGQTDPSEHRPSASIVHVDIDPISMHLAIFYKDGGVVEMDIVTAVRDTKLQITDSTFTRDLNKYPFFTFRSMYITDGNSDVDHVSVDNNNQMKAIMEPWGTLQGTYFAFYRNCISIHNTLSPDISLQMQ